MTENNSYTPKQRTGLADASPAEHKYVPYKQFGTAFKITNARLAAKYEREKRVKFTPRGSKRGYYL